MPAEKEIQWGREPSLDNEFKPLPQPPGPASPYPLPVFSAGLLRFSSHSSLPPSSLHGLYVWLESLHTTSNSAHLLDFKTPVTPTTGYTSHLNVPLGTLRVLEIIVTIQILSALSFSTYLLY